MKRKLSFLAVMTVIFCYAVFQYAHCAPPSYSTSVKYQMDEFYPPYEYYKDGEIYGFDIELGRLIFNGSPYEVSYSTDVWTNVFQRIKNREIDICGLISINESRKNDILFSDTVIQTYRAIYGSKALNITSLEDIKNFRIGVQKSDYAESLLTDELKITSYFTFNNYEDCIIALQNGAIDVIFGNQDVLRYYLVKNQLSEQIVPHLSNLYPANMAYGVSKDRPDLVQFINTRLSELKRSGVFESLHQKHFHSHSNYYEQARKQKNYFILFSILIIAAVLVIISLFLIYKLKKMVLKATQDFHKEHEWLKTTLTSIGDAVIATDDKGFIVFMNPTAQKITGYTEKEASGKHIKEILKIVASFSEEEVEIPVEKVISEKKTVELANDSVLVSKNGSKIPISDSAAPIFNETGDFVGAVMVFRDITEKMEAAKALYHNAYFDYLTNLPNRRNFVERLEKCLSTAKEKGMQIAVFFIDLDNFKLVNDRYGHHVGDILLVQAGIRLLEAVDDRGFVARMGGDEFSILVDDAADKDKLLNIADMILAHFSAPFMIDDNMLYVTPSIGISTYPENGSSARDILKAADKAMYESKAKGRNSYTILSS